MCFPGDDVWLLPVGGKHIDSIYSVRTRKSFCLKSVDRHRGSDCRCCGFMYDPLYERSLAGLFGSAQDNMRFWSVGFALHFNKSSAHIFLGNKKDTARKTLMQCHFSCSFFQEWKVDRFLCQPRKPIGFGAAPCGLSEGRLGTFAQRTNIQLCGHIPLSNYIILRVE